MQCQAVFLFKPRRSARRLRAVLGHFNLHSGQLGEMFLIELPRNIESHHFGKTGHLPFVIGELAMDHLATAVSVEHAPSLRCHERQLRRVLQVAHYEE